MIRPATPADADAIAQVQRRALERVNPDEPPPELPLPEGDTLVAEFDGQIYGFVTTAEDGPVVFVDPRAQGAGLSKQLLAAAAQR